MKCRNCGAEIAAEDRFCYACGAEVVAADSGAHRCPSCGAEVADDDGFCESCGAPLRGNAPPPPHHVPAPKPDDPSTHPLATLFGYAHNGFGILCIGALIMIVGGSEVPFGDLPEDMVWLLLPVMWFLQPLGWLAALLPGLYLVTRKNVAAKFHGKTLIAMAFLVIVLAFYLISVLAFADFGID